MDMNWWKQAHGTMTNGIQDFQENVEKGGKEQLVIVDFFMPACHYCVKFMPAWNKIVDEFKAEYGDNIQFLKVDGTEDRVSATRYQIQTFPTFIMLEPGTYGDEWQKWNPYTRDYAGMKRWIQGLVKKFDIKPLAAATEETADTALQTLKKDIHLNTALPIAAAQPNGALLQQQMDENQNMRDSIKQMLIQQQNTANAAQTISDNVASIMEAQEGIKMQLTPSLDAAGAGQQTFTVFLAGIVLGAVMGLFFASYLVKLGRMGGIKKGGK